MAQNVTIAGRQYSAVPAIDVPKTGGGTATFTDVTDTTAIADDVRQGKYFFTASGVLTLGTATGGGGTGGVTQDQDGYLVLSDQGGGGGGGWTLIGSKEVTANTTSTSITDLDTITVAATDIDRSKMCLVTVEDKAGLREGYFFGAYQIGLFNNTTPNNDSRTLGNITARYQNSTVQFYSGQFGVYCREISYRVGNGATFTISARYNSTYSKTINGTYAVKIYQIDYPDGFPFTL